MWYNRQPNSFQSVTWCKVARVMSAEALQGMKKNMNTTAHRHVFTSESVSEGHPDKVADQISDAILDECLKLDPSSHVACETMVAPDFVVNAGEITCSGFDKVNPRKIAEGVIRDIGYDRAEEHFSYDSFQYVNLLHGQSADINRGVNRQKAEKQGAGDQGMMFGYATCETKEFMPAPVVYSHGLLKHLAKLRHSGAVKWLRPDSKCQISAVYENGAPVSIETVVLSHQTTKEAATKKCYKELEGIARDYLAKTKLLSPKTRFLVNPTGQFVIGGPCGDSGLTGRKIIVDTYGGMASHGGGAFSGKDPSKVDRSAAYYARYAAKNIVAAGLAARCEIQVAYAIGIDKPVSFCVKTFGSASGTDNARLEKMLASGKIFNFTPYGINADLRLTTPKGWTYRDSAAYGHFGRSIFPWEKTDKVEALKAYFA